MIQAVFLYKSVSVKLYFYSFVLIGKLSIRVKIIWLLLYNYKQNIPKQYFTLVHKDLSVFMIFYDTVTLITVGNF